MLKGIVAWMVVKDDEYYVDMAIKSVLPYVESIYIQDQQSQDGTVNKIKDLKSDKICLEVVDTGCSDRFNKEYNEPYWRSLAIEQAEKLCSPKYLLKLDADEIYTPHLFDKLSLFDRNNIYNGARMSGDRFISKDYRSATTKTQHGLINHNGYHYYDPHTHFWRANRGVKYNINPHMSGYLHCILSPNPEPLLWIPGICNIHIHRIFGPKAFDFWAEGGDIFERITPFHPPTMAPKWFNSDINMGEAEKVEDFTWPDFVLEKWKIWGIW